MKIVLNEDTTLVSEIRKRLQENKGYCPCVTVQSEDTKCMCKSFKEQQEPGECHCGLYIKVKE